MKVLLTLIIGIGLGAAAFWLFSSSQGRSAVRSSTAQVESAAKSAGDAIQQKIQVLDLRPSDIKADLAQTGQVVRRKAKAAGNYIADATLDARITAQIKGKLLASHELSSLSINVATTEGVVTLSGKVTSPEEISKAMIIAMEPDGVREVISTIQVRPKSGEPTAAGVRIQTQTNNVRK